MERQELLGALREERARAIEHAEALLVAIRAVERLEGTPDVVLNGHAEPPKPKRRLSAKGRKAIADAARKRWAKVRRAKR